MGENSDLTRTNQSKSTFLETLMIRKHFCLNLSLILFLLVEFGRIFVVAELLFLSISYFRDSLLLSNKHNLETIISLRKVRQAELTKQQNNISF